MSSLTHSWRAAAATLVAAALLCACTASTNTGPAGGQAAGSSSAASPVAPVASPAATPPELALAPTPIPGVPYAPAPDLPEITGPVETTESGLKYSDIVIGDGPVPTEGQTVSVHYTAWLVNGTRFDSSYEGNRPKQFKLGAGEVIKGWEEGIATMHVGGRRLLVVPPELAYGSQGNGPIPPNAIVIFDVQLISAG